MNKNKALVSIIWLSILLILTITFTSCGNENNINKNTQASSKSEETSVTTAATTDITTNLEETTKTHESSAPHSHAWSEWTLTIQATCTTNGSEERTCTCGEKEIQPINALGHTEVIDAAKEASCISEGLSEGKHCSVCNEVILAQAKIDKTAHTENIISEGFAPTCTKWGISNHTICSFCSATLSSQEFLTPTGHNFANGVCTLCQSTSIDYDNLSIYSSSEGDTFFSYAKNGNAMRKLYEEMDKTLTEFHNNPNIDAEYREYSSEAGNMYTVAKFNYVKYDLTLEEAQTVYTIFRKDHPQFYWMSYMLYWEYQQIIISTVSDYARGSDRAACNVILVESIKDYVALADGETSAYNIALIYYEAILKNNSYAYNDKGQANAAQWAHSIMGGFKYQSFVCEGYAKLFQLLLNVSGVENIYVTGWANGSHVWNLVRLDDGKWYWFDLTWSDNNSDKYSYFCLTDAKMFEHTPTPSNQYGLFFNITLPERSQSAFESNDILLIGEEFKLDENKYSLSSFGTVSLIEGTAPTSSKLVYNGRIYDIAE